MTIQRKFSAGIVAAAMLINTSAPALARDFERGYGNGHHGWRHHRNHVDAGDVVAGVAVIAILAAILSSSSKNKNGRSDDKINGEDAAVDACAQAVEARAGDRASVRDITQVDRNGDGWDVEGIVEQRADWTSDGDEDRHQFTCTFRYGAVQNITIESGSIAFN
ncbi:MAG: hypothetical protein IPO97_04745 [Sphingomonadales bacterium]|nr:hypothetical protein [Sphingomonadales bacterium]